MRGLLGSGPQARSGPTAVETVFIGKDRQFNRRFLRMCGHYLVEPTACTPAAGWEKGQVENTEWPALTAYRQQPSPRQIEDATMTPAG